MLNILVKIINWALQKLETEEDSNNGPPGKDVKDQEDLLEPRPGTISLTPRFSESQLPNKEKSWPPKNPRWPPTNHIHQ